jgi:LPS-assembly protein
VRRGISGGTAFLLFALFSLGASAAFAQDAGLPGLPDGGLAGDLALRLPVNVEADTLSYDEETGIILAEGNVVVTIGTRSFRAERMLYDIRNRIADLVSEVRYTHRGDAFSFDRVVLNLETETGTLHRGRIHLSESNLQIQSERFEKIGDRTYLIRHGSLTTCPCDPECDWAFNVGSARVTLDGYAVARNVTFRIRGVPVLWLPYGVFPVKLTRQSGFLLPSLSSSGTKGTTIGLPFYWAISRWSDATLTAEHMSKRGFRPEAEYRFVLNPKSFGEITGTVFRDREIQDTRYRVHGTNVFRFGENVTANARWDIASDDRYYVDLVDPDILRTARHVPSRGFIGTSGTHAGHALSVVWVQDVQGIPDDNTVQRLPEYTALFLPRTLGRTGIDAGGSIQGASFYRREGESLYRGRGSVEISRPFALLPSVFLTPFAGAHLLGIASELPAEEGRGRAIPTGGAALQVELKRTFDRGERGALVHSVDAGARFRWVPRIDQDGVPVIDWWSRIGPQRQIVLSLAQRLFRLVPDDGPREAASLELEWAYETGEPDDVPSPYIDPLSPFVRALRDQIDIAAGRPRKREAASDVLARLQASPFREWRIFGDVLFDPNEGRIDAATAGAAWIRGPERRIVVDYRIARDLAEVVHGLFVFRPLRILGVAAEANYSIRNEELTEGRVTLTTYPRSDCWSVSVTISRKTRPDETSIGVMFTLRGIGSIGS